MLYFDTEFHSGYCFTINPNNVIIYGRMNKMEADQIKFMQKLAPGASFEKLAGGENSTAFLCGNLIVRFPKSNRALNDYQKEAVLSSAIRKHSDFLAQYIPDISVIEIDGIKAAIHHEIPGKTLKGNAPNNERNTHFESLIPEEQKQLAEDLGKFLAALHSVPLEKISEKWLQSRPIGFKSEENILSLIEKNQKLYASQGINYEKYETDTNDLVLCHNDFHGGNFALDEKNKLKGVFDLGEMGKNHRAYDFMPMYSYGRKFARAVTEVYNTYSEKKISMKELDFHYLNKLAEFPQYAEEHNRPDLMSYFYKTLASFRLDIKREQKEKNNTQFYAATSSITFASIIQKHTSNEDKF